MKIAIIIPFATMSASGGVLVQGRMWKAGIENLGHQVDLVNVWGYYDWNSYDIILFLGYGKLLIDFLKQCARFPHPRLVCAPILDYYKSLVSFKLKVRFYGSLRLKINKPLHDLYKNKDRFPLFIVRSEYEKRYLSKGLNIEESKVKTLPLSFRLENLPDVTNVREPFCFHVSRLAAPEKNVKRLIEAAVKYKFKLILAGTISEKQKKDLFGESIPENIKLLGFVSDDILCEYYRKAKVFALPSIVEGVGMVALEAAANGCNIVLTNIGAPKEYFNNQAVLVNPFNIDSIGNGILKAMGDKISQPSLSSYVRSHYNIDYCSKLLKDTLQSVCHE
jgi:glycosyltransferase involved in cell wall biosynthesis